MSKKVRDTLGKFAPKSEAPRKTRTVNLTSEAWQWFATAAEKMGLSRNDYLESLATSNSIPFMETGGAQHVPFMETEQTEYQRLHTELGNLRTENKTLRQELGKQKNDYAAQLANGGTQDLRLQLETAQVENELLRIELGNLRDAFPDAADLLNQLKAKRRKATASLADIEAILEILEG